MPLGHTLTKSKIKKERDAWNVDDKINDKCESGGAHPSQHTVWALIGLCGKQNQY